MSNSFKVGDRVQVSKQIIDSWHPRNDLTDARLRKKYARLRGTVIEVRAELVVVDWDGEMFLSIEVVNYWLPDAIIPTRYHYKNLVLIGRNSSEKDKKDG